jgi:Skp family chaperone for outer membrane proteins
MILALAILAQLAPADHAFTGQAVSVACALAAAGAAVFTAFRRQPSADAEYATKRELAAMKSEISESLKGLRGELREDFKELGKKLDDALPELSSDRERTAARIYEDLRSVQERVARLEALRDASGHSPH